MEKVRASEAEQILRSLRDAQARCILQNGGYNHDQCGMGDPAEGPNLFTTMDIALPFPKANDSGELLGSDLCLKGKDFYYCVEGDLGYVVAYRMIGEDNPYNLVTSANSNAPFGYNHIVCGGDDCTKIGYTKQMGSYKVKP